MVAEPVLATGRFKTARIQVEKLVGRQQQDFLLEQTVVLPGQRAVVLDHTVEFKGRGSLPRTRHPLFSGESTKPLLSS